MQIIVKAINPEKDQESSWYRSIEGHLLKEELFELDFNENCAFNYHYNNDKGFIYLYSVNDKSSKRNYEHKIFIKFLESEVHLAQEIVQKYLIYRTRFWESVNDAFNHDSLDPNEQNDQVSFSFDFNKILNSPIQVPTQLINKEYSLPIIIPINDTKTLELLAAGIHSLNNISIITLDTIEEDIDYHKTVFITNTPKELKLELTHKLKKKQTFKTITLASKIVATFVSIIGIGIIVFTFIKNNFKSFNKKS